MTPAVTPGLVRQTPTYWPRSSTPFLTRKKCEITNSQDALFSLVALNKMLEKENSA